MDIKEKTYFISFLILVICLAIIAIIYFYTGHLIIAILFAPPVIHWILQRKNSEGSE